MSARVIADSISSKGFRLTTIEATFHRFILSEFNTHRVFSRNSASSRAIPVKKQLDRVRRDCAIPIEFGTNQPGMQAGPPLEGNDALTAIDLWIEAGNAAADYAEKLMALGVHKQVTNRLLEPFMWHTVIVTSTEWQNFFDLRCNPLAQPEIQFAATAIRDAYHASEPTYVKYGDWHLPYIQEDESDLDLEVKKKVSAARCARVSYLTHDGTRDLDKDIELYERLTSAVPPHASPLEHVATPADHAPGNFRGWAQLRHLV